MRSDLAVQGGHHRRDRVAMLCCSSNVDLAAAHQRAVLSLEQFELEPGSSAATDAGVCRWEGPPSGLQPEPRTILWGTVE